MTNYDGRCRGGWAFGQGFDSPQVHRKRGLRVYSQASFSMDLRGVSYAKGREVRLSAGGARCQWVHNVRWTLVLDGPKWKRRPCSAPTGAKRRPTPRILLVSGNVGMI